MRKIVVAGMVVCLIACGMQERASEAVAVAAPAATEPSAAGSSSGRAQAPQAVPAALPAERMVIHEAHVELRVADPRTLVRDATKLANGAGGFVLDSQVQAVDGASYRAELSLRVPEAALERVLAGLRKLGTVLEERVEGEDVTEEFVDVSARLHAQRTLESRILSLFDRPGELKDLLTTEQELARVRTEIERVEGRLHYLQERSRMASIHVLAQAPAQPLASASQSLGSRLSNAVRRGADLAISVVEEGIVLVGFLVPTATGLLLLAAPFVWLRRRRRLLA